MLTSLFAKSVRDRSVASLVTATALVLLIGFSMGIYAGFDDQIGTLYSDLPDALLALYGTNDGTAAGLVTSASFALVMPMILLVYTIGGGTGAAVGEERAKTLDLLLMNPVSRTRVLLTKTVVLVLGVIVISAVVWLGSEWVAGAVGLNIAAQNILAACVQVGGLGLMFGALALAVGAWTGRATGSAVAAGVAAVSYLATTLLTVDPNLAELAKFTPWYLYSGGDPLLNGVVWPSLIAMLVIATVLVVAGVFGLKRRDLRS
jgi:ABC-2 type transport system permease protein